MLDIETQLQFIDTEIKKHNDAIVSLQAIRDTVSGISTPQLSSLQPLVDKVAQITLIEEENTTLKSQVLDLTEENTRLTVDPALSDKTVM
jgi:hypothetical protein